MSRRLSLRSVTMPNYAKRSITHYRLAQNTYSESKSHGVWYTTMGIGAATIGIYKAKKNRYIVHIDGKPYYLHQQAATTAGLAIISITFPPVGAVIGCTAVVVGGIILIDAVDKASHQSQKNNYIPSPRTLSPY